MKSLAMSLAVGLSLAGAAFADDKPLADQKEPTPAQQRDPKYQAKYWQSRENVGPGEAFTEKDELKGATPSNQYWQTRDPRTSEPYGDKVAAKEEALKPGERDHTFDRKDVRSADPDKKLVGISLEAGGGVGGFIDNRISSVTSAQGQWTARAQFGSRSHFAGEAAYVGSAQKLSVLGVGDGSNASITGNGLEGAFRLNVLTGMFQPYAIAGLGYMHYSLGGYQQIATSDVQPTGDVVTFPIGAGMAWRRNGLVLDSRISFHPASSSGLVRDTNLSTWDVHAKAGFEF